MGNEKSQLSGLEIDESATEVTDCWAHYQAKIKDGCKYFSLKSDGSVSVFKGECLQGPLWAVSSPIDKYSNNLIKYRHPCIIRYVTAWQQRSTLHLATEYVQPLSHVLKNQSPLQICIGLNNILRAMVFLHDQAGMSHNNISISAIYVTGDGQWKLGGLQYLCSFKELTPAYLKHSRIHRYDKAVDPSEDTYAVTSKVDQFAFAVLVEEVFKGCKDDDVPYLQEFKKFCQTMLQHLDPVKRPNLSELLLHEFFNHEFISIYKFLYFLPLNSEEEKNIFFTSILKTLKCYDEETVARQLSGLLLSRLTLLDDTAGKEVLPYILKPKNERLQDNETNGFFSMSVFKEHIKPKIIQLFSVRDMHIRLLLLTHFKKFIHVFSHEELSQHILPELLLGIKDTDDNLVSITLVSLSELVPILGADSVVGGKRTKLFSDGRPNSKNIVAAASHSNSLYNTTNAVKSLSDFRCTEEVFEDSNSILLPMTERLSPVGGEGSDLAVNTLEPSRAAESEEDWSDWENSNILNNSKLIINDDIHDSCEYTHNVSKLNNEHERTVLLEEAVMKANTRIDDIANLDIKNQRSDPSKNCKDEIDFFADMEPVIEKTPVSEICPPSAEFSKLSFVPTEESIDNEGWSDTWND